MGRIKVSSSEDCNWCQGNGKVPMETSTYSGGSANHYRDCTQCDGTGKKQIWIDSESQSSNAPASSSSSGGCLIIALALPLAATLITLGIEHISV